MAQDMRPAPAIPPVVADPGPLGLAAFALTTFVLSAHNANLFGFGDHSNAVVIGLAIFYGGLAQFMAGMWAFRNRNTFAATAFCTSRRFWLALATYLAFGLFRKINSGDVLVWRAWVVLAVAIVNAVMMFCATRI